MMPDTETPIKFKFRDQVFIEREAMADIPSSRKDGMKLPELIDKLKMYGVYEVWGAGITGGYNMGLCGRFINSPIDDFGYLIERYKDKVAYMTQKGNVSVVGDDKRTITLFQISFQIGWKDKD